MSRRKCLNCGKDISYRPKHHYLCYECWKLQKNSNFDNDFDFGDCYDDDNSNFDSELNRIQSENGLSDEDMANGAWVDFI